ncbi:MAG TPA: hypothetical protein VKR06_12080 [Ktedonosporobacter sp.]|nr:hypothetical protein [Ktedonosporobacter sp.]
MIYLIGIARWLHIVAGVTWLGGNTLLLLVVYPMLLKLPALEAERFYKLLPRYTGPLMAISGSLVVLLGIVLGTLFGPIRSLDVLGSPYGITWLAAFALAIVLAVWGERRNNFIGPIWEGEKVNAIAQSRLRTSTTLELVGFAAVLVCMVLMHFGY